MATESDRGRAGRDFPDPTTAALRVFGGLHSGVYRLTGGRVAGRMFNSPVLLLITTVATMFVADPSGAPRHPGWYWNLKANPEARVRIKDRTLRVRAEEAEGDEKRRLWTRLVEMYPPYADYQRRTQREIPVLVLRPMQ